jgi:transposase
MRPVAIGRRNWIHIGSPEAGPKVAAIFSVIECCRRMKVSDRNYLASVLPGLANRTVPSLVQLTPAAFAANQSK